MTARGSVKLRIVIVLVVVGILIGLATTWYGTGQTDAASPAAAYARGDWTLAADLARDRLRLSAKDVESARILARALTRLERDESALALYQDRVGISKMEPEDHFLLGLLIERQGNRDLAFDVWTKALRSSPDHPELLGGVARLAVTKQRPEVTAEVAEQLRKAQGHEVEGWLWLGLARSLMDDPRGTVDALDHALELDPKATVGDYSHPRIVQILARESLRLGETAKARKLLSELPEDVETAWLLSRADLQEGLVPKRTDWLSVARDYRNSHPNALEPTPFVGSSRCADCHEDIASTYQASRHARTFHHGDALRTLPLPDKPIPDPSHPERASHTFERGGAGESPRILTRARDEVSRLVIDYAFGTPERYVTMVGRDEAGAFRAARLSFYHGEGEGASGWDRTSGDVGDPDPDADVRGQIVHTRDGVVRCLACHVTNPRDFVPPASGKTTSTPSAAAHDRAIGCERCHGPGTNHLAAIKLGLEDPAILNTGSAPTFSVNDQCKECHVVGDPAEIVKTKDDPRWVRSPGLTLGFSRCRTSEGTPLACVSCHDPHRDSPKEAAFYEAKCLGCHQPGLQASSRPALCKINPKTGCVGCHMPKVPVPVLHARLTDHYIRVHQPIVPPAR